MKGNEHYFLNRMRSFRYAFAGIRKFIGRESNAPLHLIAGILVVAACLVCKVSAMEALALAAMTGFVFVSEMFNTCIEKIMDFISTETHPDIQFIKDVAAGAVLMASITALVTALIIFIPKIM